MISISSSCCCEKKFTTSGLGYQAALKYKKVKLDLLIEFDMLLTVEKGFCGAVCHAIHWHAKANNKYMKDND